MRDLAPRKRARRFVSVALTQFAMSIRSTSRSVAKKDPICVDGVRPRPMFVDYKDLDLLSKLVNRHGRIVSRRKTGCQAASQHAVSKAVKRARFMALMPYVGG
jgi:small subunit ribosomal protein S18